VAGRKEACFLDKNVEMKKYDIICAGELLIDMISLNYAETFSEATEYKRLQGGSPANLCLNMARLGNEALLVATVGKDDVGHEMITQLQEQGLNHQYVWQVDHPTTLILVTRSKEVSNFEAYRSADRFIEPAQLPDDLLSDTRILHTTCFALSAQPAQQTLLDAAYRAQQQACQLSIDANYAHKIWPDRKGAQAIIEKYCSYGALVKISEVDWERLYEQQLTNPEEAVDRFLGFGAREVCVTLGAEGCLGATAEERIFLTSRSVEVVDTTGAGDAFWSGYLTAWLDQKPLADRLRAGRSMAEIKLGHFGPLKQGVKRSAIYDG